MDVAPAASTAPVVKKTAHTPSISAASSEELPQRRRPGRVAGLAAVLTAALHLPLVWWWLAEDPASPGTHDVSPPAVAMSIADIAPMSEPEAAASKANENNEAIEENIEN